MKILRLNGLFGGAYRECQIFCQVKRNLFKGEPWPITPPPCFIAAADKTYKLGTSDPAKIKLIRLGWDKEILI